MGESSAAQRTTERDVAALQFEIEALRTAAREQEQQVIEGYREMDHMLRIVEQQRDRLGVSNADNARAQAYLDRVIDTIDEVLLVLSADGSVARVNAKMLKLTGYDKEQVLGRDGSMFFVPEELQKLAGSAKPPTGVELLKVLSIHRAEQLDGHLLTRDGSRLAHMFRWANLYSAAGKKEGVVLVGADVRRLRSTLDALERAYAEMRLIFATVDQGLLSISTQGRVASERSDRVSEWFGSAVSNAKVWEYIGQVDPDFADMLELGWEEVVDGFLPRELAVDQLPKRIRKGEQTFDVAYRLVSDGDKLAGALMVISDITSQLREAEAQAAREEMSEVVHRIFDDRQGFLEFYEEVKKVVCELLHPDAQADSPQHTFRLLHTLKGNCALFGVRSVSRVAHGLEDELNGKSRPLAPEERKALDRVWDAFTSRVTVLLGDAEGLHAARSDYAALMDALEASANTGRALLLARRLSMEPTQKRLARIAALGRGAAEKLGKEGLEVVMSACDERFDSDRWGAFWAAFAHVLRNAVDHGIEPAEARRAKGKPAHGTLWLTARCEGDDVVIELRDDGQGIDWDALVARGTALNLPTSTEADRRALLFASGVSSRTEVSETSGRGVGMAAVKAECDELGGRIEVSSEADVGTTWRFAFPRSLVV